MKMPDPDPKKLAAFTDQVDHMASFLANLWCQSDNPENLMFVCLMLVYEAIAQSDSPSPALAAVLQKVPEQLVSPIARGLVAEQGVTPAGLSHTLRVLCDWLRLRPQATHLSSWVVALVDALCSMGRTDLLAPVASAAVPQLMTALCVPVMRPGVMAVLRHLLRFSDRTVNKISVLDKIPSILVQLKKENSVSSSACIQWLVTLKQECPVYTPGKVGLTNLGNTCYMNSVLQALFMTEQFSQAVLCEDRVAMRPVLRRLQELFALLCHSQRPTLAPRDVLNTCRPASFQPGDQQDGSEFLIHLLDKLHEEEKLLVGPRLATSSSITAFNLVRNRAKSLSHKTGGLVKVDFNTLRPRCRSADGRLSSPVPTQACCVSNFSTIVQRAFAGQMQTRIHCLSCLSISTNMDSFMDIPLSFPSAEGDASSGEPHLQLQDLVDFYFKSEKLCGDNRYKCDKCGCLREALRTLQVREQPANLIVTVKHFRGNPAKKLFRKLRYTECISLPGGREYRLYAAVIHAGYTLHAGHYLTYAHDLAGTWHAYDDDVVRPAGLRDLTECCAPYTPYILFFSRFPENLAAPKPSIALLQPRLRELVIRDNAEFVQELRDEQERRRRKSKVVFSENSRDDSDDNNPPSSCGGGMGTGVPPIRFTY